MNSSNHYLTYEGAAQLTGYKVGTLRNFVSLGTFQLNVHYLKPRGGKVIFLREALEKWLNPDNT